MAAADMIVYRSTHPHVLAHWEKTGSAEAQKAWREWVQEAIAELGFPGDRKFVTSTGFEATEVAGIEHPEDEDIPVGWKRLKGFPTAITPDKRRAAGKRAAARLAQVTMPNPRKGMPGEMPHACFAGTGMALMRPGVARHGDAVYVTWSAELEKPTAERIDPAVWEQIKLSEYYAAKEQHEAVAS
jgi:hypothetical protein